MSNLTTALMLGCVCGFFLGVTAQGWRRRPTCRELMRERQPTFADLLMPPPRDRDPRLAPQLQPRKHQSTKRATVARPQATGTASAAATRWPCRLVYQQPGSDRRVRWALHLWPEPLRLRRALVRFAIG